MRKSIILAVVALVALFNIACGVGGLAGPQGNNPTNAPASNSNDEQVAQLQATIDAMRAQPTAAPAAPAASAPTSAPVASAPTSAPATPTSGTTAQETLPTSAPTVAPAAPVVQPVSQTTPPMLLVLDSSGSMLIDDGTGQTKLQAAKTALNSLVNALPEGAPVGLRVYGHRYPNTDKANGCKDTELIAPIAPLDKSAMTTAINSFEAKGFTPIALSLEEGFKDLPPEGQRTLVLVSDGEETCDRDPCQVAADLKAKGVDFVVEAVGFQVDEKTRAQLRCIAEKTGGQYRDAANADELARQLAEISQRALREYQPVGGEIFGGADYRSALNLQPGEYIEKIQVGETVYYKVTIPEGKKLRLVTTLLPPAGDNLEGNWPYMQWELETPTRKRADSTASQAMDLKGILNETAQPVNASIEFDPAERNPNNPQYGEYYLKYFLDGPADKLKGIEFTTEIAIELY